jgi:hypothetical protein
MVILRRRVLGRLVPGTHFLKLFGGVEGVVSMSLPDQLFGISDIDSFRLPLTLAIGAIGAGMRWAFIGVESAPGEAVKDIFFGAGHITALVCVFDTEDKIALVLAREKVVVKYCPNASQVKPACGAWSKPKPDFLTHRPQR